MEHDASRRLCRHSVTHTGGVVELGHREFDEAQRVDMESFRDYDLETWKAGHDDDAITVLAQGCGSRAGTGSLPFHPARVGERGLHPQARQVAISDRPGTLLPAA